MRASKLEGSIAAGEKQQRQRGHRPDDGRSAWRLSEAALAGHSGAIAERDLRTETGETGGNPEAGRRRGAKAWHPNRVGSLYPASGDAGSAKAMESNVLPIQLWVPTASVGASRRGSSAAIYCARPWMGDRSRLGKIFRSSQSSQTDGPNRQARRGQTAVEAHPGIPECRGDGERTGQPQRGRNSARRSAFTTAK